jgi:hypothetical protein
MRAYASYLRASGSWHSFLLPVHHDLVDPPERLDDMPPVLRQPRIHRSGSLSKDYVW